MSEKHHKYKFVYAGNEKYADGYDRIFGKKKRKVSKRIKKAKKWRTQKTNTS